LGALQRPQTLFKLPVAELQFLVLPGQLPDLIFQLLDPDLRIEIVGLRQRLRAQTEHRGQGGGARNFMESG
jgi:hypothetical protein